MFINRLLSEKIKTLSKSYPVIAIMGPRQSGKTTLAKVLFAHYRYISLEDLDTKAKVRQDPRGFLNSFMNDQGVIIDEAQEVPELFSYLQTVVDQYQKPGFFVLTGSCNFLLHEKITQTLAGRVALFTLLPLSIAELQNDKKLEESWQQQIKKGFYPKLYKNNSEDVDFWYANYLATYIERDVRNVLAISDVAQFQKFMKLCAARVGNVINFADLARDCDISPKTAQAWASVLQASYILQFVHPYYNNFSKRLIKSTKMYFVDIGLVCYLLGIKSAQDLFFYENKGALFENMIMVDLYKHYFNQAQQPPIFFWRTAQGQEIDCVIETTLQKQIVIEIKASQTIHPNFAYQLRQWGQISGRQAEHAYVIYAGDQFFDSDVSIVPWTAMNRMQL